MTDARISQVAAVAAVQSLATPRLSSVAIITPTVFQAAAVRVSQLVSIALVEGPKVGSQSLDTVFKPPCFVPCVPLGVRRY